MADRVGTVEEPAGEGFVDDGDASVGADIGVREVPATQAHPQHAEEVRCDAPIENDGLAWLGTAVYRHPAKCQGDAVQRAVGRGHGT